MKYLLTALFLVASCCLSGSVQAQESTIVGEHIVSFDTDTQINKDGTIEVEETIVYDFGNLERHGIFRDIPYIKTNTEGKKYKMDIDVRSVVDENGRDHNYDVSDNGEEIDIKIGSANRTITGVHTYVISYLVSGALTYFSDHDELYWNVTGAGWSVPIESVSAQVHLPSAVEEMTTACFTGYEGSQETFCDATTDGTTASFSTTQSLNSFQGLTIVAGFPKDIVAVLEPREVIAFSDTPQGKLLFFLAVLGFGTLGLSWYVLYPLWLAIKWWLQGRDPKGTTGPVRAWFEPPKTKTGELLTPAETGILLDESADFEDVSATIISLAQRGFFKIEERKKDDFYFLLQKEWRGDPKLSKYEETFMSVLFQSDSDVRIKDRKLYTTILKMKKEMYDAVVKNGYFPETPEKIRGFYDGMAVAALFTLNLPLLISAIIFGRNLVKRTVQGVDAANISQSLRNFLTSQERQLGFQAKNQMLFEKLLPYAIAFGVERIWAERFKDLKLKEPEWFEGMNDGAFNSTMFVRSMSSSFMNVQSAATPPTPTYSSSGFSSGSSGGSSGGGGGGGGGGSW